MDKVQRLIWSELARLKKKGIENTKEGTAIDRDFTEIIYKIVSKSYQGTGLGLFISKSIIKAQGGRIWAKNNISEGKEDVTFSFSAQLLFLTLGKCI